MKQILTLLSILLFTIVSKAQNLVSNFSFEEADSCPANLNDRTYEYSLGCVGWGQATTGTADYFNACDTATTSVGITVPLAGVPYNRMGYQHAYGGVAYTGINVYVSGLPFYKEYLITNIPALEVDTTYEVTIHVSLADYCEYATDGFGVSFTTYGSPSQYTDTTLEVIPQIDYTSYGVITDSTNWTTLTSTFVADSTYTFLIIGIFKPSNKMTISTANSNPVVPNISYYYIDNVIVEKLSSTGITSFNSNIVNIYPNPFTEHATMIFNNPYNQNSTLTIFNVQGQIVQKTEGITSDRIRIERNSLTSGFYYYKLSNEYGSVANGKLIIK